MARLFLRISDTVLDKKDWPIAMLRVKRGSVVKQRRVNDGAYDIPSFVGKPVKEVASWTQYDSTGNHPEFFHEIWNGNELGWESFLTERVLNTTMMLDLPSPEVPNARL